MNGTIPRIDTATVDAGDCLSGLATSSYCERGPATRFSSGANSATRVSTRVRARRKPASIAPRSGMKERREARSINPRRVKSTNPGYCFLVAGWRRCGQTAGGL